MAEVWKNKLYFGDNLGIMREYIPDESVDLIYLDPPFNSKATYNVLFAEKNGTQSRSQVTAFEDTWHWGMESEEAYREIVTQGHNVKLVNLMEAMRSFLGTNDMMAYLTMMAIRLVEMHRVLKSTGSIYLHCDPTASHYLKLVMDAIFGARNYRNEITWKRNFTKKGSQYSMNRYANNADILLFYSKTDKNIFKTPLRQLTQDELSEKYPRVDEKGRRYKSEPLELPAMMARPNLVFEFMGYTPRYGWMMERPKLKKLFEDDKIYFTKGGKPRRKNFMDDYEGTEVDNIWLDIRPMGQSQKEILGYPTQKPETLLERINKASSNEGDIVMDPFCGCGTTIAVAEHLNRKWIGIDITHLAITLMKHRLEDTFGRNLSPYEVIGDPKDLHGAKALAEHDRYQFEWWALGKVAARPAQDKKKGADSGVDGYIYFIDDDSGKAKKIVVQVKSGNIKRGDIATLKGDMEREKAAIGAFITLQEPTKPMKEEAISAGFYEPAHLQEEQFLKKRYLKLQILTIEELLNGKQLEYPRVAPEITFKKAERKKKGGEQKRLDF